MLLSQLRELLTINWCLLSDLDYIEAVYCQNRELQTAVYCQNRELQTAIYYQNRELQMLCTVRTASYKQLFTVKTASYKQLFTVKTARYIWTAEQLNTWTAAYSNICDILDYKEQLTVTDVIYWTTNSCLQ